MLRPHLTYGGHNIIWNSFMHLIDRLIVYSFTSCSRIFHLYGDVTMTGEGLQNLGLDARRSGPLSREGSLSCHTYCETGPRFFRSHPKDCPIQSPVMTHTGMWRIYFHPDPHGSLCIWTGNFCLCIWTGNCFELFWCSGSWEDLKLIPYCGPNCLPPSPGTTIFKSWFCTTSESFCANLIYSGWVVIHETIFVFPIETHVK
jgi:hypothetical protein